ncbi:MAG: hypothetical protein H7296_05395 [Bacteroidia bacterium]|nr:hypothetical protein [Bacteroidia bacterium]
MEYNLPVYMRSVLILIFYFLISVLPAMGQEGESRKIEIIPKKTGKEKGKPVRYNSFGMGLMPLANKMAGGNHISYRKYGFGLSWRFGIRNYEVSKSIFQDNELSLNYDTVQLQGWLTGSTNTTYSFSFTANFVFHLTKKIPLYIGAGVTRQRQYAEAQPPFFVPGKTEWILNPNQIKFVPNFTAGIFIPLFSRIVLNIGYDYMPQTVFVGIAISGPYNYEDLDMW